MSRWYAYMQGAGHMAARPLAYACNICIRHVTWHVRHGYGSWQAPADAIEICARIMTNFGITNTYQVEIRKTCVTITMGNGNGALIKFIYIIQ